MNSAQELPGDHWWAEGDTPVRSGSQLTYFVDGRAVMLDMCRHFLKAQHYIYLANWGMTPGIELVRGEDRHAASTDTFREELTAELRAEGLQEQDIAFWFNNDLSLRAVLGYAVSKGVEVKVLLWKANEMFAHCNPAGAYEQLTAAGVTCILDDSAQGILHHPVEALHQKISVVDGLYAYVGGVDPLIETEGEFDRWDTSGHLFETTLRRTTKGDSPHPWHDAHSRIEGPAVGDVEANFRQRWNDVVKRHHWQNLSLVPERPLPPALESTYLVQVARTVPEHTYSFEPPIIQGIYQFYANALPHTQQFVYLENQYLWLRAYYGVDIPFISRESSEMEHILSELGTALERGATMSIILPDHPNVGRAFSDEGLVRLRNEAPQAAQNGRIQAFCLATSTREDGREHYRPIYVHAKVGIIDDLWSTVGSGNLNNRGMRDDTEMNVATVNSELTRGLRFMLQAEHLGLLEADDLLVLSRFLGKNRQSATEQKHGEQILDTLKQTLHDPIAAVRMMSERAWENLQRYKANQPLVGHLLPYLTGDEAAQQGLNFREEHGWIEEP
ncbi:MAG: phospholipase D-like domain-containing protein [Ktedonobacteraceae bacterium]